MKHLHDFLIIILLSAISLATKAQVKTGTVSGVVKAAQEKAVAGATITLLKTTDSSVVKVVVARNDGKYDFENIAPGKYLISVTAAGHVKTYSSAFELTAVSPDMALKPIEMTPSVKALNAVTVTAKRPLIEQKIDRTVVNVEASITNAGTNALEVLEKSPGIAVDKDGNISLKGKDGVVILVDGRQTHLSGPDLANYLRNMNASQMDQIEIMTNPPAKYDAAGNSGIINIKTKKNRQLGYNGSVNFGYGQGYYPKINDGFNFNYRKNKVNLFTNFSHNYSENFNTLTIQRNFRDKTTKNLLSNFEQEARNNGSFQGFNGKLGMDYFPSKNTTLGVVFSGFLNNRNADNQNLTYISDENGEPSSQSRATLTNEQEWKNFSTNLNFRRGLDTVGSELTADLDYSQYNSTNNPAMINS